MKLDSIQFLRAVAATLVVYAHSIDLSQQYGKSAQEGFHFLSDVGCIGVDLFFVISGFIITYVAGKYTGVGEGVKFLQKRFYRINPIYYIATAVFIFTIMIRFWIVGRSYDLSSDQFIDSAIDTFLILPLSPISFAPLLMIGWTLTFEWLFYIMFFASILSRVKRKILLLSGMIATLIILGYIFKSGDVRFTILTNAIMLEFLLGVIICQLYRQVKKVPVYLSAVLLLTGIGWYVYLVFDTNPLIAAIGPILTGSLSMDRFLHWGIPSSFVFAGCVFLEKSGKLNFLWSNKVSRLLGDASYSIYLVHFTAFSLLNILYGKVGFFLPPDLSIFFHVAVALGVSIAFYWWVEKPLLKWLHKLSQKPVITEPTVPVRQPQAT
jgi:exopolysaccharide production protein ExoZ